MITIYQKSEKGKMISAVEKPFKSEEELEKYIMENTGIMLDVFIISRQVTSGSRKDIPDMVGVDRDGNIVIIENKNITVTGDILPQILRYAIWAQTNPDSIRAMWLEAKNRPEDIEVDWDKAGIRLIVLAPIIRQTVLKLLNQINYSVELIEVKRYLLGKDEYVLLNKLEPEPEMATKTVRSMGIYDEKYQKEVRNPKSVDVFFSVLKKIDAMIKANKWKLEKKMNKYYVGYKTGFFNVFGLQWIGTKSFGFFFKVNSSQFNKIKRICPYELEYDDRWKQASIRYSEKINIKKLKPIIKKVYDLFAEK